MVELYNDVSTFGRAARRLFLPENSIKSKLPYYRCAPCSDHLLTCTWTPQLAHMHCNAKFAFAGVEFLDEGT